MKRIASFCLLFLSVHMVLAQTDISDLFSAGLEDAERFTNDYLAPATEGAMHAISNGWYNSGEAKPLGGFEISIIGNASTFNNQENKKTFNMDTADYENLQFVDGSSSKLVSSALGDIEGILVFVEDEIAPGITERAEFELPSGLASEDINFIPSAFLQASVGIFKGTEIKARFLPKINTDDVSIGLYGGAIQHELTKHLPAEKLFPVAISAVIGYTHLDGTYDFTDTEIVDGTDQRIEVAMDTWVFQAVVSTKLPVINFYGGIGYLTGKSSTDFLGTYNVESGPFSNETYVDPFSLESSVSGIRTNIGAKLKLGFFRLNVDYTLADFNNLSVGLNFGFR
ncbi:MAG: DUF6588 family protein [Bacteroidota bacterium]